ncbi:hypothetical protein LTR86_001540 [Recurvomyces mirabilis]|nr:hypothetical protein LTR86_001540 [Recurvomyces mirabilis]
MNLLLMHYLPGPTVKTISIQQTCLLHIRIASLSTTTRNHVVNSDASNIGENDGVYKATPTSPPTAPSSKSSTTATQITIFGTSLSSPIFGSVLTLINEELTRAGKPPVGFVNPALYAHPYVLNDITNGSNANCDGPGFQTSVGWDPVTGLGTPNYPKMLELFMGLK